ncbi:DUF1330 domain-containing protein [Rhizorhabdus dicambivorans]|uniref:DUF1330 domain-containing protein n=1 Tax=Rhizorhabdus dicambivorans TaxID=1850238 RepID=A0A2A4FYW9_9SPHN|nr:DUF1330 domain-containing protein [Rhizorhabdus dicambivorans]ATE65832.1 DUF1330 domain-containing protein [Rhizorhabdus dicambivorans]PCE42946.1 DUF1330 domain-containing protein [Rhizorhabdus dicambivorans]
MAAYLVGAIDVHDDAGYARYRQGALPLIAALGDVELVSGDDCPFLFEGQAPANHLFILKFPSLDRAKAFMASADYGRCIPFRHASAHTRFIMAMRGPDEA